MKRTLLYLTPLLVAYLAGCTKKTPVTNYQSPSFAGTYSAAFVRLHTNQTTGKSDTVTANLTLTMDAAGNFTVTGDTTQHAGSYGTYSLGYTDDLIFTDKTLPATGTPTKSHLSGDYLYTNATNALGLKKVVGDSILYTYYLTKTN